MQLIFEVSDTFEEIPPKSQEIVKKKGLRIYWKMS